jgi:hypothetical protein
MLTRLALVIAPLSLTACATESSSLAGCPVPVIYSATQMALAAVELASMPPGQIADLWIPDYGRLRAQSWACLGGRP